MTSSIWGGERGILNRGTLTLEGVIVQGNTGEQTGGGVYNADGATLLLTGSSAIRKNAASLAGGGVLNAGTLELRDASSITHNLVRDESLETAEVEAGIEDPLDISPPPLDDDPPAGSGGGVMDLGVLVGAVCAPEPGANIHGNSPDDCASLTIGMPVPWALMPSLTTSCRRRPATMRGSWRAPDAGRRRTDCPGPTGTPVAP